MHVVGPPGGGAAGPQAVRVLFADDGAAASSALAANPDDLAILDVGLPLFDGCEVL